MPSVGVADDHHHVVQGSGLGLFFVLVFYSCWFFVFSQSFCCIFLDSKTRLTSKSNFFQLIFCLKLFIVVNGVSVFIEQIFNLKRQSFEHGTWLRGG